MSKKQLLLV